MKKFLGLSLVVGVLKWGSIFFLFIFVENRVWKKSIVMFFVFLEIFVIAFFLWRKRLTIKQYLSNLCQIFH